MKVTRLTLYHVPKFRSTRVLWLLGEMMNDRIISKYHQIDLTVKEFTNIEQFRTTKPHELLHLNLNGKVPTIVFHHHPNPDNDKKNQDDDEANREPLLPEDMVLFESGAICTALLDMLDSEEHVLLPQHQRPKFYQIAHLCCGTIDNLTSTSSPNQRAEILLLQQQQQERQQEQEEGTTTNQKTKVNMNPQTHDPVKRLYWDEIGSRIFDSLIESNHGDYLLGKHFTAADIVFGLDLFAFHDRLIERLNAPSWLLDPLPMKRLLTLNELLKQRPMRQFAFETSLNHGNIMENTRQPFGINSFLTWTRVHQ